LNLIPIHNDEDRQTVSARALWEFLDKPYTRFDKWFNQFKEYGFTENEDFRAIGIKIPTAQGNISEATDYEITLDMAKEISMLQRSEKGKQARQYFIEAEKKSKSQINISELSSELQMFNKLFTTIATAQLEQKRIESIALEAKIGLEETNKTITQIKDTFAELPKDKWREWVNSSMNEIVKNTKFNFNEIRNVSYELLENRAGARLADRLRNGKQRLKDSGSTKTAIEKYCKLDCIEGEKRIKTIYTDIVKELRIKHLV
jgi:anti-repressor protein